MPEAVTRVRWGVIVAFGLWSAVVWSARVVNVWRDLLLSTDEKVLLTVMAAIFLVLGVAVVLIGLGLRRWAPTRVDIVTVGVLGGWTCGVWFLRIVDIASDDHGLAFVVVHTMLAAVSIALAGLSWRELAAARPAVDEAPPPAEPGSVVAEAQQ
jgi:hypothetical protein